MFETIIKHLSCIFIKEGFPFCMKGEYNMIKRISLEEKLKELQAEGKITKASTVFTPQRLQRQGLQTFKDTVSLFRELESTYSSLYSYAYSNQRIYNKFSCVAVTASGASQLYSELMKLGEQNASRVQYDETSDLIYCSGFYYPESNEIQRLYRAEKSQFFQLIKEMFYSPNDFINENILYVRGQGFCSIPDQTQLQQMIDLIPKEVLETIKIHFTVGVQTSIRVVTMKYKG